jgi:hypothetical protein
MAALLLYFGQDGSYRLPVLACAGFYVRQCHTPQDLDGALRDDHGVDAVIVNAEDIDAIATVCAATTVPLVLFLPDGRDFDTRPFALVIRNLTSPNDWLVELLELIRETQDRRARTRPLIAESVHQQQECSPLNESARIQPERARGEYRRADDVPLHTGS